MARTAAPAKTSRIRVRDGVVIHPDGLKYMTPGRASAFLGLVRAGATLARELDAELERDHGIGLQAFEVLLFLALFSPDGRLRMVDLTERTPLSQSRVSRLVAELEARGLVARTPSGDDHRGVEVAITPTGIQKFKEAQDDHLAALERRLFAYLSADEVDQLARVTARILDAQGATSGLGLKAVAGPPDYSPPDSWQRFRSWPLRPRGH
jgi:DNA-binding MarR family transcriptional regulator